MALTIDRAVLATATDAAAKVAQKSSMDATLYAFLGASDGRLTLRATDGSNWQSVSVDCDGELADIQVNASKLNETANSIRADKVKLDIADGALVMTTAKGGKRKIAGIVMPYPEPTLPTENPVIFEIDRLRTCLAFVAPHMLDAEASTARTAPYCGVKICTHSGFYMAMASNGNSFGQMAICDGNMDIDFTITARTASLLKIIPAGSQVEIRIGDRLVSFTWASGEIVSTQVGGSFSDKLKSQPVHDHYLLVNSDELVAGITSASPMIGHLDRYKRITLHLDENVRISSLSENGDRAVEPIEANWSGDKFTMQFSSGLLRNCVRGFNGDDVFIGITAMPDDMAQLKFVTVRSNASPDKICMLTPLRG